MPSCLWHSVYRLLTVAALSNSWWVSFATNLWIPLGFHCVICSSSLNFSTSKLCFCCSGDWEAHKQCAKSFVCSSWLPCTRMNISPLVLENAFCGRWPGTHSISLLLPLSAVCSLLSYSLNASQLLMNSCGFLAERKRRAYFPSVETETFSEKQ